jgi:polyhydroxybutyrate depolymerase
MKLTFRSTYKSGSSAFMKMVAGFNFLFIPASGGSDQRLSIEHDDIVRTFHIHLPSMPDENKKLPVVFALHGRGGNGESMILVTRRGFDRLAENDKFIIVYPDGIEMNWNDGRIDEEAKDIAHSENIDDVGFICALIDLMIKDYNADSGRVYVTGISNGAIMAYRLACELAGKITAIAPVDGSIPYMFLKECSPSGPVSVLAINNVNDPLVPYDGGEAYTHFHKKKLGQLLSVKESVGFWTKQNKCTETPVIAEEPDRDPKDGTRVTRQEYSGGIEGTEVILYSVEGGGHTWPGGFQYLPVWLIGKTSRDINACEVIWSFFKKHSR